MQIFEDYDLTSDNTFHISASAKYFCEVKSETQLLEILNDPKFKDLEKLFLGGGSNLLFTKDFPGLVIKINNKGIEIIEETNDSVKLKVNAGENWDGLVKYTVDKGWGGIENLGLIPGNVGSTPVQNIGAYGIEVKSSIETVIGYQLDTLERKELSNKECEFGYRDSIFKTKLKNTFVITTVVFQLEKQNHQLMLDYGNIKAELEKLPSTTSYTIKDVYEAVCNIRRSKLPDINELGSAGSFFKNPVVSMDLFNKIKISYPDVVGYPLPDPTKIKIPAGWPVERAGWKGKRIGDVGVYEKHSLILVNYGKASGTEVLDLAQQITKSVKEMFDIILEPEVNIL